uniref:Gustatory receptor n=1 Tax=Stomoxys calcitrans TaxID=35570 RepID=A0A454A0N8_STOCA
MRTRTRWLIASCYYASQLLGILPFWYNQQTGRVHTTRRVAICSAATSLTLLTIIAMFLCNFDWSPQHFLAHAFHFKIRITVFLIRISAVIITVILNWSKRQQFMNTLNDFQIMQQKFLKNWPISREVENEYDKSIARKVISNLLSNIFMSLELYVVSKTQLQWSNFFITVMVLVVIVLNMALTNFYIAIGNINVLLAILKEQLQRISLASKDMIKLQSSSNRPAGSRLMAKGYLLAHELDALALYQLKLWKFINRMTALYDFQGSCVILTMYITQVTVLYSCYLLLQQDYKPSNWNEMSSFVTSLAIVFYYLDMRTFRKGMFRTLDLFMEIEYVLKIRELQWPVAEECLEESFKNFSLQLAKFPVEMKLVGLFKFDRSMAFSIFGSTISNAIVLIQYDYKNNSDE